MTSRSKAWGLLPLLAILVVAGCGAGDTGTANTKVVDKAEAAKKQPGQGGIKAARGGGLDEGVVPAPPGVKTGPLAGGNKGD